MYRSVRPKMEPSCVIDLKEIVRRVSRDRNFAPAVYEAWIARTYSKNWGVPCVSASLLEEIQPNFFTSRQALCLAADMEKIDLLDYLPSPDELWRNEHGIWLLFKDGYLLMGNGHAIKQRWRNLYS